MGWRPIGLDAFRRPAEAGPITSSVAAGRARRAHMGARHSHHVEDHGMGGTVCDGQLSRPAEGGAGAGRHRVPLRASGWGAYGAGAGRLSAGSETITPPRITGRPCAHHARLHVAHSHAQTIGNGSVRAGEPMHPSCAACTTTGQSMCTFRSTCSGPQTAHIVIPTATSPSSPAPAAPPVAPEKASRTGSRPSRPAPRASGDRRLARCP